MIRTWRPDMRVSNYPYHRMSPPLHLEAGGGTFIYFHIYTDGRGHLEVIRAIMDVSKRSGLLDETDEVRYCIVGSRDVDAVRRLMDSYYPRAVLRKHDSDASHFERLTLHALHEDAMRSERDARVLYLHSKGTSEKSDVYTGIATWTENMIEVLARHRRVCWSWLERSADTVGIIYTERPRNHYSGNFWWSTFNHIRRLHVPIGRYYLDPEMWVASHPETRSVSLSQLRADMYNTPTPTAERLSSVAVSHHGRFLLESRRIGIIGVEAAGAELRLLLRGGGEMSILTSESHEIEGDDMILSWMTDYKKKEK